MPQVELPTCSSLVRGLVGNNVQTGALEAAGTVATDLSTYPGVAIGALEGSSSVDRKDDALIVVDADGLVVAAGLVDDDDDTSVETGKAVPGGGAVKLATVDGAGVDDTVSEHEVTVTLSVVYTVSVVSSSSVVVE